jgi:hypothetical protein
MNPTLQGRLNNSLTDDVEALEQLSTTNELTPFAKKKLERLKKKKLHSEWSLKEPLFVEKKDKRYSTHTRQLRERGFSDSETWALDSVICKFILPRLIRFKEINNGFPCGLTAEKWDEILDEMIFAFDWSLDWEDDKYDNLTKKEQKLKWARYRKGMNLFSKHFRGLWW